MAHSRVRTKPATSTRRHAAVPKRRRTRKRPRNGEHLEGILRALIEHSLALIYVKDRRGRMVMANPTTCRVMGKSAAEMLGRTDLQWGGDTPEIRAMMENDRRVLRDCKPLEVQERFTGPDGVQRVFLTIKACWCDSRGNVRGVIGISQDVTEKVRAAELLREDELQLRQIIDLVPHLIFAKDVDGRFILGNKALADIYGTTAEELPGKFDTDFLHSPAEAERIRADDQEVICSGKTKVIPEEVITDAEGRVHYLSTIKTPCRFVHNGKPGTLAVAVDITDRKRMEDALRQNERELRQIIDLVPHLIFAKDIDGRFILGNKAMAETYGTTVEGLQGKYDTDFAQSEEEARHFRTDDLEVIHSGKTKVIPEEVITDAAGRVHHLSTIKTPCLLVRSGKPGSLGVAVDITDRKQMENALRESEALLRIVTSGARVGLILVNTEGKYLFMNQTCAELLGLPDANVVGRYVWDVLPEMFDQIQPNLQRGLVGERLSYELHLPMHPVTKRKRILEVTYEPRMRGEERYLVVVVVDVTERKQAQEWLENMVAERTAKLNEMVQELETFSYSIAHDMRAPLRTMHSFSRILLEDYGVQMPAEAKGFLERISTAAMRLDALIKDVLNYSRVVRQELPLQKVDVGALIKEIIAGYPDLSAQAQHIELSEPLPVVIGNVAALTQVISNLLGNAVKFIAPGVQPRLRIWSEPAIDEYVRIWFEDNGIGIPHQARERLFGMFQRFAGDDYPGTGMGLAIVRKAVERMNGKIGVESEPGVGSRFWVELKAA